MPERIGHTQYAAIFHEEYVQKLVGAREAFFGDHGWDSTLRHGLRSEILHSWRRSTASGVDVLAENLPLTSTAGRSSRLLRAAEPVMARLGDQLEGSYAWGMLLDKDCAQLARAVGDSNVVAENERRGSRQGAIFSEDLVGTNGAGIAAERLEPFLVVGAEHYRDSERNLVSVGAPVRDALNRLVGVVSLNCRLSVANHLLVPFARDVAWAIRERLTEEAFGDEREVFALFTQHSRRPSQAVIAVSDGVFVANAAARQLLQHGGQIEVVTSAALDAVVAGRDRDIDLVLADGRFNLRCRAVALRGGRYGVVASLSRVGQPAVIDKTVTSSEAHVEDRIRIARTAGLPVLIVGERSSGKSELIRATLRGATCAEFDGRDSSASPTVWLAALRAALGDAAVPVVLKHLDALSPDLRDQVGKAVRGSLTWCVSTSVPEHSAAATDLLDAFPVVVDCLPLRERREELPLLVERALRELGVGGRATRCSAEALAVLGRHAWRGNFGQLRRALATAAVNARGGEIGLEHFAADVLAESGGRELSRIERIERELLFESLKGSSWNREDAARALGISRATIYRKIKQFGITVPSSRG